MLREMIWLVLLGVLIGTMVALGTTRLIASMLFEVKAADPITTLAVTGLLLAVAAVAGYLPARV